eukprot:12146841-Ditylum_brightwellii.AAC.1
MILAWDNNDNGAVGVSMAATSSALEQQYQDVTFLSGTAPTLGEYDSADVFLSQLPAEIAILQRNNTSCTTRTTKIITATAAVAIAAAAISTKYDSAKASTKGRAMMLAEMLSCPRWHCPHRWSS